MHPSYAHPQAIHLNPQTQKGWEEYDTKKAKQPTGVVKIILRGIKKCLRRAADQETQWGSSSGTLGRKLINYSAPINLNNWVCTWHSFKYCFIFTFVGPLSCSLATLQSILSADRWQIRWNIDGGRNYFGNTFIILVICWNLDGHVDHIWYHSLHGFNGMLFALTTSSLGRISK